MNKEELKRQYSVNADKIAWKECENGGYKWKTSKVNKDGFYINEEKGGKYTVVDSKTNSRTRFRHNLADLEEL